MSGGSVFAQSLFYLAYGKAVTLDGSPARLVLVSTTKLIHQLQQQHQQQ